MMALVLVIAITVGASAACRRVGSAGTSSKVNPIVAYLDGAELQAEQEQLGNVCKALQDLATGRAATLRAARYADYQGQIGSWDLPTLLRAHFVPRSAAYHLPEGEAFWAAVEDENLQAVAQSLHARHACSATQGVRPDR
jgi:hypothetical protein